jgi:cytochrome oxidase Cu insertion factor (SCO1/SenC/PrrC family)
MAFFRMERLAEKKQSSVVLFLVTTLFLLSVMVLYEDVSIASSSTTEAQDFKELKLIVLTPPPRAPAFALKDLRGKEVRLSMFQEKPLMLYFWATW